MPGPPPVPADFQSPDIETERVRAAMEAVLQKHLDTLGPHYDVGVLEVTVEGVWAHGVAAGEGEPKAASEPIHLLARRDFNGAWQALLPSEEGLFPQWVEKAPKSLISTNTRQKMLDQGAKMDAPLIGPTSPDTMPTSTPSQDPIEYGNIQSMRNPAAVYCTELGYEYEHVEASDDSQRGLCRFPNDTSCNAWDFLTGYCGQDYNACAREGLSTVISSEGDNPFAATSALCVDAKGKEITSAIEAVNLVEKSIGAPPANTTTIPQRQEETPSISDSEIQDATPPSYFDWRNYQGSNWMTPIKNQGICGSCWAFSAVGVAEAATNIGYRDPNIDANMSEQYLVTDCAVDAGDCAGGWGTSGLAYIRDAGISDEGCLPYHDGDPDGCTFNNDGCRPDMCTYCSDTECSDYRCTDRCSDWSSRLYSLARIDTTWQPDRAAIKDALLSHGPLAVSIYMGGSFDGNDVYHCDPEPDHTNHGVSIVGYNDASNYWMVRNSWGSTWNDDGYFKVAYGNCLIERYFTYADLAACNDENEINDSADFATPIAYDQTLDAEICYTNDIDFYQFYGMTGDKVVIDIDAQSEGSALDSYVYLLDSDGSTVLAQNDDERPGSYDSHLGYELSQDGTYYIKVRDYGYEGGTDYTYDLHLLTDAIPPTAEIISPTSDAWIDPITQTITTNVNDDGSGIRNVTFYWHDADWENSDWVVLKDDLNPDDGWNYDFNSSAEDEQRGGAFFIYAYDWAGNQASAASWNLGIDRTSPTVTPDAYPMYGDAPFRDFHVNWWNNYDNLAGIASYDVQYRDGAAGAWTDFVISTTQTYTRFLGLDDHTYYFRARARDYAGNLGAYSTEEVSHTVDICETTPDAYESDDAVSSARWITPDGYSQIHNFHIEEDADWVKFEAQAGVTYTLSTGNTGGHADTVLELYDTDGSTLLAFNDDCPNRWPSSCLDWQAPGDGTYYVKVYHWDEYAYGCTTEYGLSIVSNRAPALELGEPGISFRYTDTFGVTETAYPADTAHLNGPNGLFIDDSDNLYLAEELGARLLKYNTSDGANLLSIGTAGLQNRGEHTFNHPTDVAVDSDGDIWTIDRHRVAQYDASGNFLQEFPPDDPWNAGDDNTHFDTPRGIAFDSSGRMYVSDSNNHRIQVYTFDVEGTPVYSTTVGVTGEPGSDAAHFNTPAQIFLNSGDFLYVADVNNYRVQRCSHTDGWSCSTIHGTGSAGDGADNLNLAYGLAEGLGIDGSGDFYIADSANGRVKECSADMFGWTCNLFATGLEWPAGVAVDSNGHVYVSDFYDHTIHKYDSSGAELGIFMGTPDAPYLTNNHHFNAPYGVAVDSDGNLFLTEYQGYRLIKLSADGTPQWSVGEAGVYGSDDTHFGGLWDGPAGVAVDGAGNAYVADTDNHRVQKCTASGSCRTFAGVTGEPGSDDDHLEDPFDVAIDANGNVYVADQDNHRVQKCTSAGVCTTFAGVTNMSGSDNTHFNGPMGVAVDGDGNVYVSDAWNQRVQKCLSDGSCTTFAGVTGEWGEDFGHFLEPRGVAVDDEGRIYVADIYHQRVQVFDSEGAYLTTLGGIWGSKTGELRHPAGVAVDNQGTLYIADNLNARVQSFALGVPDWQQVNINGFGDPKTTGVTALAEFSGYLYAGASNWNSDHGQIWRTTDETTWENVTPTSLASNALLELSVYEGYLYAGTGWGGSAGQIWRSSDGITWSAMVTDGFGDSDNEAVTKLTAFEGHLYAAVHNNVDGFSIWRSPTGDAGSWEAVVTDGHGSPNPYIVTGLTVFNDQLYAACENESDGAEIWRSGDGSTWEQVASGGFDDPNNTHTGGFAVFDDQLYIGTRNNTTGAQLWRSSDGATWSSVITDGFGDNDNQKLESLHVAYDALYAVIYNDTGAQVWRSDDGSTWDAVRTDGWGDANNYATLWSNATMMFNGHLHIGTWNDAHGGELWQANLQHARADFDTASPSGVAPLTVVFTNTTTGDYDTCTWDFGDGATSNTCDNPTHEYASDGAYTVTLTVSGLGGTDILTRPNYITTYEAANADFTTNITEGIAPLTVVFTNTSTGDYDTCTWDFGDGATNNTCDNPTHEYASDGAYTVTLTVSGQGGINTLTRPRYITIYDPVEAEFNATPTSGPSPLEVNFTNLSTGDYDTCRWDFGDGEDETTCGNPTHKYAQEAGTAIFPFDGIYTVTLAISGRGGINTLTRTHYITTYEPVQANFSAAPITGITPITVAFTNQSIGAYDTCRWDFGDGNTSDDCDHPTHLYESGGTYTVSLTVSGLGGENTYTCSDCVTFYDQVQAAFTASPTSGTPPLTVNFSNQSLGDYDTCTWDFGDGETSTQCNGVQHTYEEIRSYTVELTVNGEGGSDTETKWDYITVNEGNSIFLPLILRHHAPPGPTNAPPYTPNNPSPADDATSQSVDVDLSWTGGDPDGDSVTYAIYLEPDDSTPDVLLSDNQVATSYDPGTLNAGTHYYWQIVATDSQGATTTGPIWEFSTKTSPPPNNLLTPFDANEQDVVGPSNWATRYGKTPEIIVSSNGVELDVLAQDYNPDTAWHAVLLHIEPNATGYEITQSRTDIPMLDRVMGLATDDVGNRYYATGVDESDVVDPTYPPPDTYRSNIVRVIKLDPMGNVLFNIDLDTARHAYDSNAEMIINPMTFASSRLAVGGNEIALVHSINTNPDSNGVRHQKALSTRLNATSGAVTRVSSVWVSHSFDQRLCYDGEGIIEHHLGDAYPRYIVFARDHTSYSLFHIKGATGENNTHTRLGNIALIENDATYDYIALFATENSAATGNTINGPRNLAIVRVNGNDNSIDPNLPDTLTVTSSGEQYTNRLRWLTQYTSGSNLHAERPKLIGIGGDQYIILWEEWLNTGDYNDTFNGVHGMVIDDHGNILQEATLITDEHHLHRGDDAFLLDNRAAWMTGSATEQKLYIHLVDASLNYESVPLD